MSLYEGDWPWCLGAAGLAVVMLTHWLLLHRPLGVSGFLGRLVRWREERASERASAVAEAHPDEFEAALIAATIEAGGEAPSADEPSSPAVGKSVRFPLAAGLTFFIALICGGLLGAAAGGGLEASTTLGDEFTALFGQGWRAWLSLFAGGVLVGAGTTMAGGCTSGHGLNGCARLEPGSLVATASFMAAAIAVSLLLAEVV